LNDGSKNSSSDLKAYTKYKKVYCVGYVDDGSKCNERYYTTEDLMKYYQEKTGTDKLIIVNPNDIKDETCEQIGYMFGKMKRSYCKDSLLRHCWHRLKMN
jgi:methionine synthase II (cobalamin-independent)